jgi:hypothetical protein
MHYIPYVNNPELLKKSYYSARFMQEVTVIDNRGLLSLVDDPRKYFKLCKGHKWRKLDVSLTTAQIMNYMLIDSYKRGDKFFTWQHGDVEYSPDLGREFEIYVQELHKVRDDWGIIYTNHDLVAAYNVEALMKVYGWDQYSFPYYFLDNDIACRLDYAGYKMVVKDFGGDISHYASASINTDDYRQHINGLLFPICNQLLDERHKGHVVQNIGEKDFV